MSRERLKGALIVLVALVALVSALVYGSLQDGEKDAVEILRKGTGRGALPAAMMKTYDSNGDGGISQEEYPGTADRFLKFDANSDRQISIDELEVTRGGEENGAKQPKRPGRGFVKKYDKDDDKRISAEEYPGPAEQFDGLDVDDDGLLTALEAAFRPKEVGIRVGKGKKAKKGKKGKGGKGKKGKKGGDGTGGEATAQQDGRMSNPGGVSDKVEKKNRNPKDTLTFHSDPEDPEPPAEGAPIEETDPDALP